MWPDLAKLFSGRSPPWLHHKTLKKDKNAWVQFFKILQILASWKQKIIQCYEYKGFFWGGKNGPNSPYYDQKGSEIVIFRQWVVASRKKYVAWVLNCFAFVSYLKPNFAKSFCEWSPTHLPHKFWREKILVESREVFLFAIYIGSVTLDQWLRIEDPRYYRHTRSNSWAGGEGSASIHDPSAWPMSCCRA